MCNDEITLMEKEKEKEKDIFGCLFKWLKMTHAYSFLTQLLVVM